MQNVREKQLEVVLRQLTAHSKLFLKTHVSNRERLEMLIAQAERALQGGDDARCGSNA